ncbi:MAG: hypothetical protein P4M00_00620 [Azospirillaceae bacterium]|nr:hypothetical protein [Azospirillaceae bacterium]
MADRLKAQSEAIAANLALKNRRKFVVIASILTPARVVFARIYFESRNRHFT